MNKKAEMGVGTLIVFIAMLLVAAVAAGVLIQTVGSLQEKSLSTGQQAETQISTNAEVIEVSATDGSAGNLTDFQELIKLSPGSDPIKLDQVIFTFNTIDDTSTLKYRDNTEQTGVTSVCEKNNVNGYNTWNVEELGEITNTSVTTLEEDYDDDGVDDTVVLNTTDIQFRLSSAGNFTVTLANSIEDASTTTVDIGGVAGLTGTVSNATHTFFTYLIDGNTNTNGTIDSTATVQLTPYKEGEGYFSVVYEQRGTNFVDGNLQRGDVIRLCYEAPSTIGEDELVRLNFIPKIGTATMTQFVTPDVIATQRVYLYP